MKTTYTIHFFLGIVLSISSPNVFAQLYSDASSNLPDNGAKGQSMDVRAVDVDQDNDLDIVLANEFQPNTILLNDGHGVFTKAPLSYLPQETHDSEDVAIGDYNGDTYPDLIFCSEDDITLGWTDVHEYYLGDGTGEFIASEFLFTDTESNAVITSDINQDGLPDVLFGNKGLSRIYINQGDGTFVFESNRLPNIMRTTQDLALSDVDLDGDQDLFFGNENGNLLYFNNGEGIFSDSTLTHLPQGLNLETRKVTFGDVDTDGDQDIFLSNVQFIAGKNAQNRLFINDGTGHFTDGTTDRLPADSDHTIDAIFEDIDLDSDLDIVVGNVFGAPVKIYRNDGDGFFEEATTEILGQNYFRDALGVIAADLNGDGLRDLYICDRFMQQTNRKDLLFLRNPITSIREHASSIPGILIYPNPVVSDFYIETTLKLSHLILENLQGQAIDTLTFDPVEPGKFHCSIDHLDLSTSVYILNINGIRRKLMVTK